MTSTPVPEPETVSRDRMIALLTKYEVHLDSPLARYALDSGKPVELDDGVIVAVDCGRQVRDRLPNSSSGASTFAPAKPDMGDCVAAILGARRAGKEPPAWALKAPASKHQSAGR